MEVAERSSPPPPPPLPPLLPSLPHPDISRRPLAAADGVLPIPWSGVDRPLAARFNRPPDLTQSGKHHRRRRGVREDVTLLTGGKRGGSRRPSRPAGATPGLRDARLKRPTSFSLLLPPRPCRLLQPRRPRLLAMWEGGAGLPAVVAGLFF